MHVKLLGTRFWFDFSTIALYKFLCMYTGTKSINRFVVNEFFVTSISV